MSKKNAIQRYLVIIRKIKSHAYISLEDLHHEVREELQKHGDGKIGFSIRTLKRDLQDIRNELSIPIEYSRVEKGYCFSETEAWSPDNIESILEPFDILNSLNADTGLDKIVFPERKFPRGTEYLLPLIGAIRKEHPVFFYYRKYGETTASERRVNPYALKECRNRWYLLGRETNNQVLKTFGLDRISGLEILPGKFKKLSLPDMEKHFRDLFGILDAPGLAVEEVVLAFDSRDGNYLKSLPLHPSQEILKDNPSGNEFVVRLHLKITRDLIMELLSRSRSLKVIRPSHLREEICAIYREALERNRMP